MTQFDKASLKSNEPSTAPRPATATNRVNSTQWSGNQYLQRMVAKPDNATNQLFLHLLIQQQVFSDDPIHFAVLLTDNAQAYDPILKKYGYKGIEGWLSGPGPRDLAADAKRYFDKAALAWYRAGGARFLNTPVAGEDEYGNFYQGTPQRNALEALERSAQRSIGVAEAIGGANLGLGALGYFVGGDKGAIIGNFVGSLAGTVGLAALTHIVRSRTTTLSGVGAASADRHANRGVGEVLADRDEQQQAPAANRARASEAPARVSAAVPEAGTPPAPSAEPAGSPSVDDLNLDEAFREHDGAQVRTPTQLRAAPATPEAVATRRGFNGTVRAAAARLLGVRRFGQVHHAIEINVMSRYPGVFTPGEINAPANFRGIPPELEVRTQRGGVTETTRPNQLHNSKIREVLDRHYRGLDAEIARRGLRPGTREYNGLVRTWIGDAVAEVDFTLGQFFSEQRARFSTQNSGSSP